MPSLSSPSSIGSSLTNHSWHSLTTSETLSGLSTTQTGLTPEQASKRLAKYGLNEITKQDGVSWLDILFDQFNNLLVGLLFFAAVFSFFIRNFTDGFAIIAVLLINATVGFLQEYKAEKSLEKLQSYQSRKAQVIRGGESFSIDTTKLVPGDIVELIEGNIVPADIRLLKTYSFQTDESTLTGESAPVSKQTQKLSHQTHITEATNLVFSSTQVVRGRALGVVYATGDQTEMGNISQLVQTTIKAQTPLQKALAQLAQLLAGISVLAALPIILIGFNSTRPLWELIMISISLAVSAIPEGLPIVVTIALAIGTRRMIKKKVLVRKLSAVEALGSTDVICTDKTGTLTQNKMTVTRVYTVKSKIIDGSSLKHSSPDIRYLTMGAQLCNNALDDSGDPTEKALSQFAKNHKQPLKIRKKYERLDEIPFSSDNRYMITLNKVNGTKISFIKGAPEVILSTTSKIQDGNSVRKMTDKDRQDINTALEQLTQNGLRPLAIGYKKVSGKTKFSQLSEFVFVGLVGLIDPPRAGVTKAIKSINQAGVRVIMITGDHPLTATSIAKQVGIDHTQVTSGTEISAMSRQQLETVVKTCSVFARVTANQKISILRALNNMGHKVAMTGDGVNDAPALKEAHIGIAVGSGTDLAKEVADMVILDDNFVSITEAIYEGRGIFENLKKFVTFLVAANFDEIFTVLAAILFSTPLPLTPIHLLWLNMITDTFPALALAFDPYPKDIKTRPPTKAYRSILQQVTKFSIVAGILGFLATFGIFSLLLLNLVAIPLVQTITFTTTVFFELWLIFSVRSHENAWQFGILNNPLLIKALGVSIFLQLFAIYFPYTQPYLDTVNIPFRYWGLIIPFSISGFAVIEMIKYLKNKHADFFSSSTLAAKVNQFFEK